MSRSINEVFNERLASFSTKNDLLTRKASPKAIDAANLISQLCNGRGLDVVILGSLILEALAQDPTTGWSLSAEGPKAHYELTHRKQRIAFSWVQSKEADNKIRSTQAKIEAVVAKANYDKALVKPLFDVLKVGLDKGCYTEPVVVSQKRLSNVNAQDVTFYFHSLVLSSALKVVVSPILEAGKVSYNE